MNLIALLTFLLLALLLAPDVHASEAPALEHGAATLRLRAAPEPLPSYRPDREGVQERRIFWLTWGASFWSTAGVLMTTGALLRGIYRAPDVIPGALGAVGFAGWTAGLLLPPLCAWAVNDAPYWLSLMAHGAGWLVATAVSGIGLLGVLLAIGFGDEGQADAILRKTLIATSVPLVAATLAPAVAWRAWRRRHNPAATAPAPELRLAPALTWDDERHLAPGLALAVLF